MKISICLFVVSFLIFSCVKKEISILPFEATKNVTCDDLYEKGYRRIFGIDVDLIGKKYDNIEIVYNKQHNKGYEDKYYKKVYSEIDTILSKKYYKIYKNENWLEIPDSIYYAIWGKKEVLKKSDCEDSYIFARNYTIALPEKEIINIRNVIDTIRFKVLNVYPNNESKFEIENFRVVNLSKKDTFQCRTYKDEEGKYHFSTSIQYKDYE